MSNRTPQKPPLILPVPENVKRPLWSIMIPAYNCIQYLKYAIISVLNEDEGIDKMQIEVIDDYSTDGDVKALVKEIGNGRVGYFRQEKNVGSIRNFESCISRSTGHWIHILHGDDMIKPGFYKEIEYLFKTFPEAGAAFTDYSFIDNQNNITANVNNKFKPGIIKDFIYKISIRQLIQPPAIVVQRKVYEELGSFYAVHYGEDWEMWNRIATKFPVAYSPKNLANYRSMMPSSISNQSINNGQNIKDILKVISIVEGYLPIKRRKKIKKTLL
jgi:glycosyltransferase involved in cell wall biosynthesis